MRSEMAPGAAFPDYELSDHTAKRRQGEPVAQPAYRADEIQLIAPQTPQAPTAIEPRRADYGYDQDC
jgi:hypothetical protein